MLKTTVIEAKERTRDLTKQIENAILGVSLGEETIDNAIDQILNCTNEINDVLNRTLLKLWKEERDLAERFRERIFELEKKTKSES